MIHELEINKNYLIRLLNGKKKAEIRFNDRDYQLGDTLKFLNTTRRTIVGDLDSWVYFRITHIHSGLGLATRYVSLSVERLVEDKNDD